MEPIPNPEDEKKAFARRLKELCDEMPALVPRHNKGRQTALGKLFGVGQKAADKWLKGDAMPELFRCIAIAKQFHVTFEWLMTGRGPKYSEELYDRRVLLLANRMTHKMKTAELGYWLRVFEDTLIEDGKRDEIQNGKVSQKIK
jgi:transcriptional regulator with XRE-family HTH domain